VDIVPTKIGQACHVWLPAATAGEANLTSMNGERRMRLTERYMDPPGEAMPDCLIAARIANHMERVLRELGDAKYADQFKGFDWKTEEDAFMDGYAKHEKGGEHVTYARLRAMGTNGFQEPATSFQDGKIVGTKRLYADGKFGAKDGKATFLEAQWRGLQAPGKEEQKKKFKYLINNGRTNHVWQNAYLDQDNEFVMDRWPYPFIEMNPDDMKELNVAVGDLVEVYNDDGSTQAMAYPTPTAKKGHTFMLFADRRAGQRGHHGRDRRPCAPPRHQSLRSRRKPRPGSSRLLCCGAGSGRAGPHRRSRTLCRGLACIPRRTGARPACGRVAGDSLGHALDTKAGGAGGEGSGRLLLSLRGARTTASG